MSRTKETLWAIVYFAIWLGLFCAPGIVDRLMGV